MAHPSPGAYNDPPILAFLHFPCRFRFVIFLALLRVFPFFPKDFKGSAEGELLAFVGGSLLFCLKSKDWRVRVQ